MSVLRSTCLLSKLVGGLNAQSLKIQSTQIRCITLKASQVTKTAEQTFDEKNAAIGRPVSPHLTIYAPQLTSMMSISYRVSGMALSGYAIILGSASFMTPDLGHAAQAISDYGIPMYVIFPLKFMLALPATYHLCNGIRHLFWDSGRFFTLKGVYTGGYITLAATFLSAFYLAL